MRSDDNPNGFSNYNALSVIKNVVTQVTTKITIKKYPEVCISTKCILGLPNTNAIYVKKTNWASTASNQREIIRPTVLSVEITQLFVILRDYVPGVHPAKRGSKFLPFQVFENNISPLSLQVVRWRWYSRETRHGFYIERAQKNSQHPNTIEQLKLKKSITPS